MKFRETKGLARHHREASGAGMRRQSRSTKRDLLPKCHVAGCLLVEGHADPHRLKDGTRVFGDSLSNDKSVK